MEKILKYRCFPLLMFIISLGWMNQAVALSTDSLKCGKKKIIVGGDFDYKPYTFLDSDGAARGYDVDIISIIAEQHNFDLEFQFTRWTEALENLKSGKVDVLLGVFYTEQRALVYDFTIPHTVESYGLFVRKQSEIKELDDIFGKQLIVLKGDASIEKFIKPMGLYENSVQVNSLPYAIGLLSSGMHDVVIAPYSIAIETIESEKIKNIAVIGSPIIPSPYRFAVRKGDSELLSVLNDGIDKIKVTGKLQELQKNWQFHHPDEFSIVKLLRHLFMIIVPIAVVIVLLVLWSWTLSRKVKEKTAMLVEKTAQLEDLNATKDKLFSIIAHDLRSPFSGILGLSDLLLSNIQTKNKEPSEAYLRCISTSAQNTLDLLENLLNWAKSQTGQITFNPRRIAIQAVIEEIVEVLISSAKLKNITINNHRSDETDIDIYADPRLINTVLRNLISNAIKFTNINGQIDIYSRLNQDQIEISISDNGVGMNDVTTNQLFRIDSIVPTTGTENETGTGFGLILCKEFVEKHGGKIWVESQKGVGSVFTFSLPV